MSIFRHHPGVVISLVQPSAFHFDWLEVVVTV
jgi:hypothetical protein